LTNNEINDIAMSLIFESVSDAFGNVTKEDAIQRLSYVAGVVDMAHTITTQMKKKR